jgi:uncharacterized protein YbcI
VEAADLQSGRELNAALTEAFVRIQTEQLDRRHANATAFCRGNVVVAVMHNVLTHAEKVLAQNGSHDDVILFRGLSRHVIGADFRAVVERLTGRTVIAYFGTNHLEPDIAAEILVLDTPV